MQPKISEHLPRALAVLFRSSHFGLCVVNPELRYVEVNRAWCEMIDHQRAALLGKPFLDFTHPDDMALDEGLSKRLFAGEIPFFEIRKRWLRRDGSAFGGNMLASALHMGDGKSLGIAIIQREESRAECVARSVGHDLNNLLLIIQGSAKNMRSGVDSDLVVLEGAVERAKVLAHSLLAAGSPKKRDEVSPVKDVITRLVLILEKLLPTDVALATHLPHEDLRANISPMHLDQVLMNLVVNARDAMPSGGLLEINVATDHRHVSIEVRDSGVGMSPEVAAQIFEPRFTTKAIGQGHGLGLAIVRTIVEEANGGVRVESEAGCGTSVYVTIPSASA